MAGISYNLGIHVIAKDQHLRSRGPDGGEGFDKGRVSLPWSRSSGEVVERHRGFV